MPYKTKIRKGPNGAILEENNLLGPAFHPFIASTMKQTFGDAAIEAAKETGVSALKQGLLKGAIGVASKGLPAVAIAADQQPSFNAMAQQPWIDEGLSEADYRAKKAGKPMGVQYPTGKRGPSYVKPAYKGQSYVSSLLGVKNPKR